MAWQAIETAWDSASLGGSYWSQQRWPRPGSAPGSTLGIAQAPTVRAALQLGAGRVFDGIQVIAPAHCAATAIQRSGCVNGGFWLGVGFAGGLRDAAARDAGFLAVALGLMLVPCCWPSHSAMARSAYGTVWHSAWRLSRCC